MRRTEYKGEPETELFRLGTERDCIVVSRIGTAPFDQIDIRIGYVLRGETRFTKRGIRILGSHARALGERLVKELT